MGYQACRIFLVPGEPVKSGHIKIKLYLYKSEEKVATATVTRITATVTSANVATNAVVAEATPVRGDGADVSLALAEAHISSSSCGSSNSSSSSSSSNCNSGSNDNGSKQSAYDAENTPIALAATTTAMVEGTKAEARATELPLDAYAKGKIEFNHPDRCFEYISEVQVKATYYTVNIMADCDNLRENIYEKLVSSGHITTDVPMNRIRIREKM